MTTEWTFGDGSDSVLGETATHTYTEPGLFLASFAVTDQGGAVVRCVRQVQVGWIPEARITSPTANALFRAGDVISLVAEEHANITQYTWSLSVIHNDHYHPVFTTEEGATLSYEVEDMGHSYSDRVHLEIVLAVEDALGLMSTTTINLYVAPSPSVDGSVSVDIAQPCARTLK